jgi:predicted MPP superfamily phosphohydrolase
MYMKEEPDFIAITGDLVSGQMDEHDEQYALWTWCTHLLSWTFDRIDVPWGFVPGYHDYEVDENSSEEVLYSNVKRFRHMMVPDQNSAAKYTLYGKNITHKLTYNIPIFGTDYKTEVARLWFFESGFRDCYGEVGRSCIERD